MEHSECINEITKALLDAQSEFEPITKNTSNPFYKSKYATLDQIIEKTKPALAKNGLVISQALLPDPEAATIETLLMHTSGQWINSIISLKPVKNDPQGMGSAITYARRYSLSAILNIATEEDDDANASLTPPKKRGEAPEYNTQPKKTQESPKQTPSTSPEASELLEEHLSDNGDLKPMIDMAWFNEMLDKFAAAGIKKWSKAMTLKALNTMTGRSDKVINEAVKYLTKEQADAITINILETEKML